MQKYHRSTLPLLALLLGAPKTDADGEIMISGGSTLAYTGKGETTDRTLTAKARPSPPSPKPAPAPGHSPATTPTPARQP